MVVELQLNTSAVFHLIVDKIYLTYDTLQSDFEIKCFQRRECNLEDFSFIRFKAFLDRFNLEGQIYFEPRVNTISSCATTEQRNIASICKQKL